MTNVKKVVAVLLAFLMMFSSVSVLASAWDADVDDGKTLEISTKFFKNVDGVWVETTKVRPNDEVKARVYLGTDYYSNDSALLFFYDKAFFTHEYSSSARTALTVNPDLAFATENNVAVSVLADPNINSQTANGYVDSAFLSEHAAFGVTVDVGGTTGQSSNVMYDDSNWLFEINLKVAENATGEGDLFVESKTVQNTTTQVYGAVNVPKGPETGTSVDVWPMWLWDATAVLSSQPVSTVSTITFNANTGAFAADNTETFVIEDQIDAAIDTSTIPSISKDGYSFMGWIDAADETPTYEEIVETLPTQMPENDTAYNAFWMENVDITFANTGDTAIPTLTGVTPYADFADIADPTKDGYTFVGWDVRGGDLPETYPAVDTTYTAVWALNVTVSFDTDGGTAIPSIDGYEGADFTAYKNQYEAEENYPVKEGHYFVMWSPELPTEFPEQDTTYTAIYETRTYVVNYYVDGRFASSVRIPYGDVIPTRVPTLDLPAGKNAPTTWYTDEDLTMAFTAGTTMMVVDRKGLNLYGETTNNIYNAIFDANGGSWEDDDSTSKTIAVEYESDIIAPGEEESPYELPVREGYTFEGWDPYPGTMDQANDITFKAVWVEAENTATYYADGSVYAKFENIAYGADLEIPDNPDKEGYTFLGWSDVQGATQAIELPEKMPTSSVIYYAVFQINQYTITFDADGGDAVGSITQNYNTDVTIPSTTKTGYVFDGWTYTTVNADGETVTVAAPTKMPAYDVTATANWILENYEITWIVNGTETKTTIPYGATLNDYAPATARDGYDFTGWSPALPADGKMDDVGANGATRTYTAQYSAITYDAIFNANDGTYEAAWTDGDESKTVPTEFDKSINKPATDPVRTGYTFKGWTPEVGNMDTVGGETYTATWEIESYEITWIVNGAETVTTIPYGATLSDYAPATARDGYNFNGWSPALPADGKMDDVGANGATRTYTAQYSAITYNAIFNANDGTYEAAWTDGDESKTAPTEFDQPINKPATDPVRTGYTFKGWTPEVGNMDTVGGETYTATWEIESYEITWVVDGKETKTTIPYGATLSDYMPDTTKTGYSFGGWTPAVPADGKMDDVGDNGATRTYTAVLNPNTYDAIFNATDGTYEAAWADGDTSKAVPTAFDTQIVAPGAEGSAYELPVRAGYDFNGWTPAVGIMDTVDGETYTATWIAQGGIKYTVETYVMNTEGNDYTMTSKQYEGVTDTEVTAPYDEGEGFALNTEKSVLSGKVTADGKLVLKVYLDRKNYTVTRIVDDESEAINFLYGSTVSLVEPSKTGYGFGGWTWTNEADASIAAPSTMPAYNVKATATWTPNTDTEYRVVVHYVDQTTGTETTFEPNFGDPYYGTTDNTIKIVDDIPDPAEENTDYVLWSDLAVNHYELDESAANEIEGKVAANGSTVLDVYYIPVKYTATFNATDGTYEAAFADDSATKTVELDYYSLVKPAAPAGEDAPVREGYTFLGWANVNDSTRLTGNRPFYADWEANEYTLTWVIDTDKQQDQTYSCDENITVINNPTKEGHSFGGWNWVKVNEDGTEEAITAPTTMPAYNVKAIAIWNIQQYEVIFYTDNTQATVHYSINDNFATEYTIPEITKTGYDFGGWVDVATGLAVTFTDNKGSIPENGATYYATWNINKYTITFDTVGGTAVADINQDYATPVTIPTSTTKTGYVFDGWTYTTVNEDGETVEVSAPTTMPAYDVTATANWTLESYEITWIVNGAETVTTIPYGATLSDYAPATARDGYNFDGWSPALPADGKMDDVGANGATRTYTAQYSAITYNAIFNANDGTYEAAWTDGDESKTVPTDFDQPINKPATDPVRTGYTFKGWTPEVGNMDTVGGETYTATWEIESYEITWVVDGKETKTTIPYGATLSDYMPDTTKTGYSFGGWTPAVPADGKMDDVGDNGATRTYTAVLNPNTYDAIFNATDGTYEAAWADGDTSKAVPTAFDTQIVAPGAEGSAYELPERAGYDFNGWTPAVGIMDTVDGETYTATWIAQGGIKYTVETYVMNTEGNDYTMTSKQYDGVTDETVTAPYDEGEGFTLNTEKSVLSGKVTAEGDLVLKVYLDRKSFNVKTVVDGSETSSTPYLYGSTVTVPTHPTQAGYSFSGWTDAEGTKYTAGSTFTMPAKEVTLSGTFTINSYKIDFISEGTAIHDTKTADYNTDVEAPATNPSKTGYSFKGWATTAGVTDPAQAVTFPVKMPENGTTYYAIWVINSYKIDFISEGTTIHDTKTADYNTDVEAPATNPSKTGYSFKGWATTAGVTDPAQAVTFPVKMPENGTTYYAIWVINQYTVNYYTDDTKADLIYTLTADYGQEYNVPTPNKKGHTFTAWVNEDAPDTATGLVPGAITNIGAADVNYYATWDVNVNKLIYMAQGGYFVDSTNENNTSITTKEYDVAYGTTRDNLPVPSEDVKRVGYTFNGWANIPETMPDDTHRITAMWTKETYKVTFDVNGTKSEYDIPYGDDLLLYIPVDTERAGYEFTGWTPELPDDYMMEDIGDNGAAITYTATYVPYTYDAIFNATDGTYEAAWADGDTSKAVPTVFDTQIVAPGEEGSAYELPVRAGYDFNGWTPAVGIMDTVDGETYTATWIAQGGIKYTVETYVMNTEGNDYTMTSKQYDGVTDETVTAPYDEGEGFTLNTEKSVLSGKVTADGKLVLKVYLDRKTFNIKTVVDGEDATTTPYLYGAAVTAPVKPSTEGYTFHGWYSDVDCTVDAEFPANMTAGDITVYGKYTVNQYDAKFYVGDEIYKTVSTNYGEVPVVADPVKPGYKFISWDPALTAMGVDGAEYTAIFTPNTDTAYTVEIYTMGLDGQYGAAQTLPMTGTTDTLATYNPEDIDGFSVADTSVLSGNIDADGGLVLKVYYIREQYKIYTVVDNGTPVEEGTYYYGADIQTPDEPKKAGHSFSGWDKEAPATMPANDLTFTGSFTANTYKIIYMVDNAEHDTQEYVYDTTVTALDKPVKTGYTFHGWYSDADCTVDAVFPANMTEGDITVYGKFTINTYKIIYMVDNAEHDTQEYVYDTTVTALAKPEKTGYTFHGWYSDADCTVDAEFPANMTAGDITVYGKYTVNQYDAKFYVDNEIYKTVPTNYGEVPAVADPVKAGYTFIGWDPALAAMGIDGAEYNAIFEAKDGIAYTVKIHKMDIPGESGEVTYTTTSIPGTGKAGETASYTVETIEGFTFDAASSTNYDAEKNTVSGTIAGDGSLVLDVYYTRKTVTVDVNGETDDYYYGEEITLPEEPTGDKVPEGNEFAGWVDEDGDPVEEPYYVPDEEDGKITIRPSFTPLDYTVTFNADGVLVSSFDVTYGEAINAPDAPEKPGYYFATWSPAVPAKMPAQDMVFEAVYEVETTGVEYYVNGILVGSVSCAYGDVIPTTIPSYATPTGYTFDGWYTKADKSEKLAENATFGTDSIKLYAFEIAIEYDAVFDANGGAWADGDTTKTVKAAFDSDIIAPADPEREGYEFGGWDPYVGTMIETGMSFTAIWIPETDAFTVTYYADGEVHEAFTLAVEDELDVASDPDKEGYSFKGWAETEGSTTVVELPKYMPASDLNFYAVFEINKYNVTFYDYDGENDKGPAADADPGYVAIDGAGGSFEYDSEIVFPAEPSIEHYTFTGWVDADGKAYAAGAKVPAGDLKLYATYDRVSVKLVPAEGTTTVIERDGVRESYNDGDTVTAEPYATPASYDYWFVYGIDDFFFTGDDLKDNYLAVLGDGTIEVTETDLGCGTGSHIKVIDNVTGEVAEEFYLVIFGDLNGDTVADFADATMMDDEAAGITFLQESPYFFRAADLDGDQFWIDFADATIMDDVAAGIVFIDQTVGYYM